MTRLRLMRPLFAYAALAVPIALSACATRTVQRIDPMSTTDMSGRWNDADSRMVADALLRQSLDGQWLARYAAVNDDRAPTIIVGEFRNRTYEHIPIETFVRDIEHAFVHSSDVKLVASRAERVEVRDERADQQQFSAPETRAKLGRELGAKFMLQGDVQAIEDRVGRDRVRFYQIDVTLIDLESNAKVWTGQHKIKKFIHKHSITG